MALTVEDRASEVTRMAITLVIFFFALRGSRVATNIWAILSLLGGLLGVYAGIKFFAANFQVALALLASAALVLANSAYFFFSPAIRSFQRRSVDSA